MTRKTTRKTAATPKPAADLPPDVVATDTKWPEKGILGNSKLAPLGLGYESGFTGVLTFYRTERFGWVLTTLGISKGKRYSGQTDRSYGISIKDEGLVTVGKGPHVLATVEVYLSDANLPRLQKYLDLWKKGMAKAGDTRDRISTRRANTIARRPRPGSLPGWASW